MEGAFLLIAGLLGWRIRQAWPLLMPVAGFTGIITGLRRWRRFRAAFAAPALGFTFLGLVFSLFSFRIVATGLQRFVLEWWPSLLIACGISLFVAYGYGRRVSRRGTYPRPNSPTGPIGHAAPDADDGASKPDAEP
jgi:hypothetical protein